MEKLDLIKVKLCEYFSLEQDYPLMESRKEADKVIRNVFFYLAIQLTSLSFREIGAYERKKALDSKVIEAGFNTIELRIENEKGFRNIVKKLILNICGFPEELESNTKSELAKQGDSRSDYIKIKIKNKDKIITSHIPLE